MENESHSTAQSASDNVVEQRRKMSAIEIGEKLYQWRDYTPLALIFIMLFVAEPRVGSATFGLLLIAAGEVIRLYSVAYIGSISRSRSESTGSRVIKEGPYALVRNPMYLGNFFIVLGILVYSSVVWFTALGIAAFAFQYYYIVKYEESLMLERFGDDYQQYLESIPGWVPARLPKPEDFPMPDHLFPALQSEKRTLLAIAAVIFCLVLTAGRH